MKAESKRKSSAQFRFNRRWIAAVLAFSCLAGIIVWRAWRPGRTGVHDVGQSASTANAAVRFEEALTPETLYSGYAGSESCRACHSDVFELWAGSDHALAERKIDFTRDKRFFEPSRTIDHAGQTSRSLFENGRCKLFTLGFDGERGPYSISRVFAREPLYQFLVEAPGGRFQVTELAVDPDKGDWFDVYGKENRQPGEWGHWTGRGMNWNSMCAACHNTRVRKNYHEGDDVYDTTMAEMAVGCEACHGPMRSHVDWQADPGNAGQDPTIQRWTSNQVMDTCGSCHSRRSELTGDFHPGERYLDHYLPSIPDETEIYYADGQVRDEDFVYISFLSSRMHAAGVTCADCHDPHSGETLVQDDSLCMRCHGAAILNAPLIDITQHSHHKPGTSGGRCVDCHMPATTYMQRDSRRDHGFTIPDPLLTVQYGVPNACTRCHKEQTTEWALQQVEQWYGDKMDRPSRARAQLIARGRKDDVGAIPRLIKLAQEEPLPLWRASLISILGRWVSRPEVDAALLRGMKDSDPLVRAKAVQSFDVVAGLSTAPEHAAVEGLLKDSVRAVRVEAAWVLRRELDTNSVPGRDLLLDLGHNADQPAGAYQLGIFHLDRGDVSTALKYFNHAVAWDPNSAPFRDAFATALSLRGRLKEAVEELQTACRLAPREVQYRYRLALARNEAGDLVGATGELKEATQMDPSFAPAWYNLGLAYSAAGQTEDAISALMRAENLERDSARAPYALATVFARLGRIEEARAALDRALRIDPRNADALNLLQMLSN